MRSSAIAVLLIAALGSLAACDRCDAPAPGGAPSSAPGPLRASIQGLWSVRPARQAVDKARADLRKAARGDERKLEEMVRAFEESTAGTTVEITGDALITRAHDRQVGAERYEVLREQDRAITLRLGRGREQVITLEPDGSLSTDMDHLGPVSLQRQR